MRHESFTADTLLNHVNLVLRYYPISSSLQTRVSDIHFNRSLCEFKNAFPASVQSPGRLRQHSGSGFTFYPANLQGQQVETPVYQREVTILGHASSHCFAQ